MARSARLKYAPTPAQRQKHGGISSRAVIRIEGRLKVGKCSTDIGTDQAEDLLNTGHKYSSRSAGKKYPERVYNVYDGVPYRAQHTDGGRYHGFPIHPDELKELPSVRSALEAIAEEDGDLEKFNAWLEGGWREDEDADDDQQAS